MAGRWAGHSSALCGRYTRIPTQAEAERRERRWVDRNAFPPRRLGFPRALRAPDPGGAADELTRYQCAFQRRSAPAWVGV
jgi:hypothetical protein